MNYWCFHCAWQSLVLGPLFLVRPRSSVLRLGPRSSARLGPRTRDTGPGTDEGPSTKNSGRRLLYIRLFPGLAQLEPVERILHQQLARSLERIVLPLRKSLPVVGHQDAPPIGVAGEVHPEHVVHLALEPVRGRPDAGDRRHRLLLADLHLDPHTMAMPRRIQAVDHIEAPLGT